ncbi:hypothetical protein [Marinobacter bohaiensis]|uniref:hypothetical protein n=1 Tax=Marinobacter bohaiensis TaxID=2201898 RepID=UPI000DAB976B|nr:hypothetical protein [Marinobacter bohaiensis]
MLKLPPQPDCCELCDRPVAQLTRHHLIPRRLHGKKRFQKLFSREDMITRTLWVCRPCHNAIHGACSEHELGMHYNTRNKLMQLDELRTFVDWLKDKPEGFVPKRQRRG